MKYLFPLLLLLSTICSFAQKKAVTDSIAVNNKDVLLLAILLNNYLKETDADSVNLATVLLKDTAGRISRNFEKLALKSKRTHISVYYKFSSQREKNVQLTSREKERLGRMRYTENEMAGEYDGEIQFDFGERSYRIRKIKVRKE